MVVFFHPILHSLVQLSHELVVVDGVVQVGLTESCHDAGFSCVVEHLFKEFV